jgi:hypothetical protein
MQQKQAREYAGSASIGRNRIDLFNRHARSASDVSGGTHQPSPNFAQSRIGRFREVVVDDVDADGVALLRCVNVTSTLSFRDAR